MSTLPTVQEQPRAESSAVDSIDLTNSESVDLMLANNIGWIIA